jgi:MFS family permease
MTSLTLSPALVALVETAGSSPVVLAALPAGALADIVDRRRMLIVSKFDGDYCDCDGTHRADRS